jgi:AcrR family transcriptional regulator
VPVSPLLRVLLRSPSPLPDAVIDYALECRGDDARIGVWVTDLLLRPELSAADARTLYDWGSAQSQTHWMFVRYWGRAEHSTGTLIDQVRRIVEAADPAVSRLAEVLSDVLHAVPEPDRDRRAHELITAAESMASADSTGHAVLTAIISSRALLPATRLRAAQQLNSVAAALDVQPRRGRRPISEDLLQPLHRELRWLWAHDPELAASLTTAVPQLPDLLVEVVSYLPVTISDAVAQAVVDALTAQLLRPKLNIAARDMLFAVLGEPDGTIQTRSLYHRLTAAQRAQLHAAACTVPDAQVVYPPFDFPGMNQVFAPAADRVLSRTLPVDVAGHVLAEAPGTPGGWRTLLSLSDGFTGTVADLLAVTESVTSDNPPPGR